MPGGLDHLRGVQQFVVVQVLLVVHDHRREREAQVLAALRQGDSAVEAMTARIYRGLPPHLVRLARDSVTAHLFKLERERRARRDGDLWHIMEP